MGHYVSGFRSLGLSPVGEELFTLNTENNQIEVNLLCPNLSETYNDVTQQCEACVAPCNECYSSGSKCTSCQDSYYWTSASLKCFPCISHCLRCTSDSNCKQC